MLAATTVVVLSGLVIQLAALWGMGDRRPIGDESEFLKRGRSEDPYAPLLFLRVPVLPWLASLCEGSGARTQPRAGEQRLRLFVAISSAIATGLVAIVGWRVGGPPVALISALLLALHAEKVILGCHIWPDTILAMVLAALMLVSTFEIGPASVLLASGLCTLGVLTRIDFVVAVPLVVVAWTRSAELPGPLSAAILFTPPLAALVVLSLRNSLRYRIPLPDTTWAFNLMVARADCSLDLTDSFEIENTVRTTASAWRNLAPTETAYRGFKAFAETLSSPVRLGRGLARRFLILIGPDTFIRQKLLPKNAAYPDLGDRRRRRLNFLLVITSPLVVSAAVIGTVFSRSTPSAVVWPSAGMALVAILFHTRTRYRAPVLPALSLVAAQGAVRLASIPNPSFVVALAAVCGIALVWALLQIRYPDDLKGIRS